MKFSSYIVAAVMATVVMGSPVPQAENALKIRYTPPSNVVDEAAAQCGENHVDAHATRSAWYYRRKREAKGLNEGGENHVDAHATRSAWYYR